MGTSEDKVHFDQAIVRPPGSSFAQGITNANLGGPDLDLAQDQHQAYCEALEMCGVSLIVMQPDAEFPDSTFVEDTAVLTRNCAILTLPGATSRRGEVESIKPVISRYFENIQTIRAPGTLDGGDICQVDNHFFIGISERTNANGAQQLASILLRDGYTSSFVNLRSNSEFLHLKSGIAYLGDSRLVLAKGMERLAKFEGYEIIYADQGESYAANCLRVNDYVLVAEGFPKIKAKLAQLGYQVHQVEVSEFQKMDGGLSCLSLRY
jgi:dimethylargininase